MLGWVWMAVNRAPCSPGLDPWPLSVQLNAEQMLPRLKRPKFSNIQEQYGHICVPGAWAPWWLVFVSWCGPHPAQKRAIHQGLQRPSGVHPKLSCNVRLH